MRRVLRAEILDGDDVPADEVDVAYRQLTTLHRLLGNTEFLLGALRGARSVVDIGCARGDLLRVVRERLGVDGVGVDLRPPEVVEEAVRILRMDAVRERLPEADVGYAVFLAHHLAPEEVTELIRNVGRSCRRLILVDVVRHWIPLTLFRLCIGPWASRIVREDGILSIQRAYTPEEMAEMARAAGVRFQVSVTRMRSRMVLEVEY